MTGDRVFACRGHDMTGTLRAKVRLMVMQPRLTIIQAPMTPGGLRRP